MSRGGRPDNPKCVACGRKPRGDETPRDTWRRASDGIQELSIFCPECFNTAFRDSTLLNLRSSDDLDESHVWGGSSRYLMDAYYRTDDATAVLRDGFRDRDYALSEGGDVRCGVLVSWPWPASGERDPPDQGQEGIKLSIPESLFLRHKLPDEQEDDLVPSYTLSGRTLFGTGTEVRFHRALIPATVLNQVTLTCFEAEISLDGVRHGREVEMGSPHLMMDAAWLASDEAALRRYQERRRKRREMPVPPRHPLLILPMDLNILLGAGDTSLARSAFHASLLNKCEHHLKSPGDGMEYFDFVALADFLYAEGEQEAAAQVLERYLAAFNERENTSGSLDQRVRNEIEGLRTGQYEVPEQFAKMWTSGASCPANTCVNDGR